MANKEDIEEENKMIRRLRFIVDFFIACIQQSQMSLDEAIRMAEDVKRQAPCLFPDKEEAFDIICKPRFKRITNEKFLLH
ncbi:MAG: hypothetical protein SWO11_08070 [Thermodesulfobacteriota bacterium]|nr:hypothetical protein [Thermodesulfobacteriota bacterium]